MISDKLLINLKIMSKIQKNGRIARSYDGIISLESDTYYQPLKRFISSDSRKQAVFEINSIITECIDVFNIILNSKHMNKMYSQSEEYFKGCEDIALLLSELQSARNGIEHLRFTYQNDPNVSSQLDIIVLKINTTLRDMLQKINYLQTFIQNPDKIRQYQSEPTSPQVFQSNHLEEDLQNIYNDSDEILQLSHLSNLH